GALVENRRIHRTRPLPPSDPRHAVEGPEGQHPRWQGADTDASARMNKSSAPRDERSGADRSSRPARPMSVLVMSADAKRRGDWAKFFEDQGMHAIRCAGPEATTCALEIG